QFVPGHVHLKDLGQLVANRRAAFDALRKHYPPRREITGLRVATGGQAGLQRVVRALGAQLV
ncbi:DUF3410 domain-containing protein, partial [Pseudomonas aeruginosa]|uniref:DUF3410 domain-containing protein n=1 Tax=Pseudomonas aeruginosa TaxID=287 RepID=UPI00188AB0E7